MDLYETAFREVRVMQRVGDYLYVSGGREEGTNASGGLTIYDANTFHHLGTIYCSQVVLGMQVVDDYAYLATDIAGLAVVDVRNPSQPVHVGRWDTPGPSWPARSTP